MAFQATRRIWMNGDLVPWDEARIHVLSHTVHYGSSVFEGIRCYATARGPAVFRLDDHLRRLVDSAKVYRMEVPWSRQELTEACLQTVRDSGLEACYIRPLVYRGFGDVGVNPIRCPVEVAIAVWGWGAYLGDEALAEGVDVQISSWTRIAPNTLPAMAKASANYANSQLIKMEAIANGYAEGIALDASGYVSEGSGENLFVVRDGAITTPPLGTSVLPGITRATVLRLAQDAGIACREAVVPREALYVADEVFLSGTAAEITPIRSVDRIPIGAGRRGPVTERLQAAFRAVVTGEAPDAHGWLTPVR